MEPRRIYTKTVTIAASGTLSTALNLGDGAFALVAIQMPAAWSTANIKFDLSIDERPLNSGNDPWAPTNWFRATDDTGTDVLITAAASNFICLSQNVLLAARHLRIVSTATQAAERALTCIYRAVG